MMKNKCSELGCMREAVKKVSEFAAFTLTAPVSATELVRSVCVPCGAVAQLGERLVRNEEASGSIPLSSTVAHLSRWLFQVTPI
jgi:hypothetical protein